MEYEQLKKGEQYYYWSKSIHEKSPNKKLCRLEWFNRKYARVFRYDLDLNKIQTIDISRLLPGPSILEREKRV